MYAAPADIAVSVSPPDSVPPTASSAAVTDVFSDLSAAVSVVDVVGVVDACIVLFPELQPARIRAVTIMSTDMRAVILKDFLFLMVSHPFVCYGHIVNRQPETVLKNKNYYYLIKQNRRTLLLHPAVIA
ncbi:MAG: hypothetical protein IJL71_03655 [Oscillospiraceae bacterium]|nr:hypothetical protein [Oscillospiraceae bacterium]